MYEERIRKALSDDTELFPTHHVPAISVLLHHSEWPAPNSSLFLRLISPSTEKKCFNSIHNGISPKGPSKEQLISTESKKEGRGLLKAWNVHTTLHSKNKNILIRERLFRLWHEVMMATIGWSSLVRRGNGPFWTCGMWDHVELEKSLFVLQIDLAPKLGFWELDCSPQKEITYIKYIYYIYNKYI